MPRYIEADDAICELKREFLVNDFGKIVRCISRTQTADVRKNVHAHWVIETEMVNGTLCSGQFCSDCGYPQYLTTNFCPNCGADMREGREDD